MNSWEVGYAAMAVITLVILFVQIMVFALRDKGEKVGFVIGTIFLALIFAAGVSLVWPIAHVLLLCGMVSGGTKRKAGVNA